MERRFSVTGLAACGDAAPPTLHFVLKTRVATHPLENRASPRRETAGVTMRAIRPPQSLPLLPRPVGETNPASDSGACVPLAKSRPASTPGSHATGET